MIPKSCVASAFPLGSGHGRVAELTWKLGLFQDLVLLQKNRSDSTEGFSKVVRSRLNYGGAMTFLSLYSTSTFSRALSKYNLVHFASPHFFHLSKYVAKSTGIVHDLLHLENLRKGDNAPGFQAHMRRALKHIRRLDGVVVVSHETDRQLRRLFPDIQTSVIHNWTDDNFKRRNMAMVREQLGLPMDRTILLNVGLDDRRKNIDLLPSILKRLPKRFLLVRIGQSDRIADLFPSGQFRAFDFVPSESYPLYFNAANVLINPSREEGFGIPLIEAVNSGTALVASDIAVFREVLGPNYPFFASPDNPSRWAEAVLEVERTCQESRDVDALYSSLLDYYRPKRAHDDYVKFLRGIAL
jgi:glycosyltransferase involved in cell wall biosynthesis